MIEEIKHIYKIENNLDEDQLNALGDDGWELVTVIKDGSNAVFYFKQPWDENY